MNSEDKKPLVVFFLDALDSNELDGYDEPSNYLKETHKGNIDVSELPQMVTPSVLGRYFTGKTEEYTGMIRTSHPFMEPYNHPQCKTFLEDLEQKILIYNVPMTLGIQVKKGVNAGSGCGGQFRDVFNIPNGAYNMWVDNPERIANQMVDTTSALFSTVRTSIRNGEFDIYFIGFRLLDSLTHFHYDKGYRQGLANFVATQVALTGEIANVAWFSDHGGMAKTDTFFINKWLENAGCLSTTVLYDRHEEMLKANDDENQITQQVGPFNAICQIDKGSMAVSNDSYDSSVDVLLEDDAPVDDIIDGLMATGMFTWVKHKSELYDKEGPEYDRLPAIIPKRAPGVLVSSNVHKDAGPEAHCQCTLRDGVHSPRACFGANFDIENEVLKEKRITPIMFHEVLKKVFEGAPIVREGAEEEEKLTPEQKKKIHDRLEALGYV